MKIIIFDETCKICSESIQLIQRFDTEGIFTLLSRNDTQAQEIMQKHKLTEGSIVYKRGEEVYIYSDALLEISIDMGVFFFFYIFKLIPKRLRDYFYRLLAKYRYKISTPKDSCRL